MILDNLIQHHIGFVFAFWQKTSFLKFFSCTLFFSSGRTEQIYDAQLALATYFDQQKDYFLSDQFYTSAHQTSRQIRADGGRKEAEANCNLGKAAERKKDYQLAIKLYEKFYSLAKDKPWKIADQDEMLLCNVACQHLLTAHVSFSNQVSPSISMIANG